jgi:hypothetical protein
MADLGPRQLAVPSSVHYSALAPLGFALLSCLTLPPVMGFPVAACAVLLGVGRFFQGVYPAIVSLDEEGFTITTTPWRRPRVVLWTDCSAFMVFEVDAAHRSRFRVPPDSIYFTDAARRRPWRVLSCLRARLKEGNNSVMPRYLGGVSGHQTASVLNRYRYAYGKDGIR